jgi:hypothetical protein
MSPRRASRISPSSSARDVGARRQVLKLNAAMAEQLLFAAVGK